MNKNEFDDALHALKLSEDGSYTAYSKEYDEHYHSTKDGALKESYVKHVIPAYKMQKEKNELHILDICYGLGFNTLCTVLYYQQHAPQTKLFIYSPELDADLIRSLKNFTYPDEFQELDAIITQLSEKQMYESENLYIEIFLGDAREYVQKFENRFDIVYQDAFSPSTNPILWTKEYFADIAKAMKKDAILTTYSIALKIRLALYKNGFNIYLNRGDDFRDATVASLSQIEEFELVNMEHKIACNPTVKPLLDEELVVKHS
jgi:tRNA U34 5-methylaminomethyl-2-thiouridine-forming methyltransferase MnmC